MTTLNKILFIVESKGKSREVGFSFINLSTKSCNVGQFSDTYTNTGVLRHILKLEPDLLLMIEAGVPGSRIPNLISQKFPTLQIDYMDTVVHSHNDYIILLEKYCLTQKIESLKLVLSKKFYCQSSMIGLFQYLLRSITPPQGISFSLDSCDGCTLIDFYSIQNLELIRSIDGKGLCLLSSINHCLTQMGSRFLRQNIIQPPKELTTIYFRQKLLKSFLSSNVLLEGLQSILKEMPDLDNICSRIEQNPPKNPLSNLKTFLELMDAIKLSKKISLLLFIGEDFPTGEDENILLIKEALSSLFLDSIYNYLFKVLDDKAIQFTHRISDYQLCNLIRRGINSLLDVAHQTLEETIEDLMEYSKIFSSESGIEIKVKWNNQHKFIWTFSEKEIISGAGEAMEHLKIIKAGNTVLGCTNIELLKFNERIQESIEEIGNLSEGIIYEIRQMIQLNLYYILQLNEVLSLIDMIQGFAQYSIIQTTTTTTMNTPTFQNIKSNQKQYHLEITDAHHPILLKNKPITLKTSSSLNLITGPNMSGKSCLIKQIILLQIMAQIGMNLPLATMKTRTFSSIFTRIGSDDDLNSNASTFAVEMREISYMIEEGSSDSLIIIDELGRGTSVMDGLALTTAICEYLIEKGSFTFFVTHFPLLISYLRTFEVVNHLELCSDLTISDLALKSEIPTSIIEDYVRIKSLLEEGNLSDDLVNSGFYKKKERKRIYIKYCNLLFDLLKREKEEKKMSEDIKILSEKLNEELDIIY